MSRYPRYPGVPETKLAGEGQCIFNFWEKHKNGTWHLLDAVGATPQKVHSFNSELHYLPFDGTPSLWSVAFSSRRDKSQTIKNTRQNSRQDGKWGCGVPADSVVWEAVWYLMPFYHSVTDSDHLSKSSQVAQSCPTFWDPMDCSLPGSSVHGIFPGKSTGVVCHFLLQGIFPTQGSNPGLQRCRQTLYHLSHQEAHLRMKCKYFYSFNSGAIFSSIWDKSALLFGLTKWNCQI